MTSDQARALVESADLVAVERGGLRVAGLVIGFIDRPAIIVERDDGHRVAVAISGAQVTVRVARS